MNPAGTAPKRSWTSRRVRSESPNATCPLGGAGTTADQASPTSIAGTATARPASGPAAAMSNSEFRSRPGERIRMIAPSVPRKLIGSGMK